MCIMCSGVDREKLPFLLCGGKVAYKILNKIAVPLG